MSLTKELKEKAKEAGFAVIGISEPNALRGLPYGKLGNVTILKTPEEELAEAKSVILMGIYAWDRIFNVVADPSDLHCNDEQKPRIPLEGYQFYYEVVKTKAWRIAHFLEKKGFDSIPSVAIPLKTASVKCGLGYQGKSTLLVTPTYGPRVRLVSVITNAELDVDEPFREDLCGKCERCIRACPTRALEPYKLEINRCMVYSCEYPNAADIPPDVRELAGKLIERPTSHSFTECTTCLEACPIGKSDRPIG